MMYSCERCSPSEAGGRGPKLTSFATCSYAFAPSKPPVWSAGGATSANRGAAACAGRAAPPVDAAELDDPEDADEGAFDAPQATTPDSTATADAIQNLLHILLTNLATLLCLPTRHSL